MNKFSENLKKVRKDNNLSQEQLAEVLGVSRQAISKWESAAAYPEMDKIITLCEKFNLNIDDLLHKDIREVKGEEESKKTLNKYVDDFLGFITDTINMFGSMTAKSKFKCLFEQIIISGVLFLLFLFIGLIGRELTAGLFNILPNGLYYFVYYFVRLTYVALAGVTSAVIVVHIFKTRYLDYYQKIKETAAPLKKQEKEEKGGEQESEKDETKPEIKAFEQTEDKIIIRDPKHSGYKFVNGLSKVIVGIIKFFALCVSVVLFVSLICFCAAFIVSFATIKTGLFFVGLFLSLLSAAVINTILVLLLLNFVFNRKNDKKKMICIFLTSLIVFGAGSGFAAVGALDFEILENDTTALKTETLEFDMTEGLAFVSYPAAEYIEADNENIKVEFRINKCCEVAYTHSGEPAKHFWAECNDQNGAVRQVIKNFINKKIVLTHGSIESVKIYTTKENIEILEKNLEEYNDTEIRMQETINHYEERISEMQQQIDEFVEKEWEYQEEINDLKDQLAMKESDDQEYEEVLSVMTAPLC